MAYTAGICITLLLLATPGFGLKLHWDEIGKHEYGVVNLTAADYRADGYVNGFTWHEARDICVSQHGDLLSMESQSEQNFVSRIFSSGKKHYYWTGLNRLDTTAKWEWSDGRTDKLKIGQRIGYQDRNKKCAILEMGRSQIWTVENCGNGRINGSTILEFICTRIATVIAPPTLPATHIMNICGECPAGWTDAGNNTSKCYRLFELSNPPREVTWNFAEASCLSLPYNKPNLACANTQGETDTVTSLVRRSKVERSWFGLRRNSVADRWIWADNSRMNVTKFHRFLNQKLDYGNGFIETSAIPSWSWDVSTEKDGVRATMTSYVCQVAKTKMSD